MAAKLSFDTVKTGDVLPTVKQQNNQELTWKHAVASLDYNPVHTHPEWCKTAQVFGLPVTVMHGNQTMSLMCKVITDWAYPVGGRMKKIDVKLIKPVPVGTLCTYGGEVTERHPVGKGGGGNYVTTEIWAKNDKGELVGIGTAQIYLP
jgi:3-hydroxybutyryl-CoA dehydratase